MSEELSEFQKASIAISSNLYKLIKSCDDNSFLRTKDDIEKRKYELVFLREHKFDNEADIKSHVYYAIRDVFNDWKDFKAAIERYAKELDL